MEDDLYIPFLRLLLHQGIITQNPVITVARFDSGLGDYVDIKSLSTSCNRSDISGGVRVTCTASDTSSDTYNADAVFLRRNSYSIDAVSSNIIARYLVSINKNSNQRVDITITIDLTSSRAYQ